jgi:glycosyltransferase involved in cell wall biosynthesis
MRILLMGPIPMDIGGRTSGGIHTHLWDLAKHLKARNHQVAVLADNYITENKAGQIKEGIQVYGRRCRPLRAFDKRTYFIIPNFWKSVFCIKHSFGSLQSWLGTLGKALDYQRTVDLFRPDLIHVHDLELRFPYAHFLVGRSFPIVATVHSTHSIEFTDPPLRDLLRQLIQRNLKLAQNLIFVSHFVRKRYEELFPNMLDKMKTWVIHNPVDISKYYPIPKEKARHQIQKEFPHPLILFVGHLIPRKGVKILIESAAILKEKKLAFHLMIIGDGPERAELKNMIEEKGLLSCVSLEGQKSQAELLYYYNASDLFVLPSFMESFGLVFFEAMLCGSPIIGTPSVLSEILPSADCGYVTPQGDVERLAATIEAALHQHWDRKKIRTSALTSDWGVKIEEFERVYQNVTGLPK